MQQLQAVRSGPWKLYLPLDHNIRNLRGKVEGSDGSYLRLYDVRHDIGETREVSDSIRRSSNGLALAENARKDLGDLGSRWDRSTAGRLVEQSEAAVMDHIGDGGNADG